MNFLQSLINNDEIANCEKIKFPEGTERERQIDSVREGKENGGTCPTEKPSSSSIFTTFSILS